MPLAAACTVADGRRWCLLIVILSLTASLFGRGAVAGHFNDDVNTADGYGGEDTGAEAAIEEVIERLAQRLREGRSRLQDQLRVEYADQGDDVHEMSDEWVVHVEGGADAARQVAEHAGYTLVAPVKGFPDNYVLQRKDSETPTISLSSIEGHDKRRKRSDSPKELTDYENVVWAERQRYKRRVKRDVMPVASNADHLFNDPLWPKQWPLHDTRTAASLPKLDLHVIGAWKLGYTGKGVVVCILDDGIQHNHTDLSRNYDPLASYDLNDNDDDPMPTFNDDNKHGTRCAGEVAMEANNNVCGVGVAYDAKIGGIRMLDGKITDRLEAEAWGPNDDGRTVEGPGRMAEKAILDGISEGRKGKGTIYVWASGNGGTYGDDCNCDGYTDSIFTLSVSSASQGNVFPWYGEKCASTITTTYSSGAYSDQRIATVDLGNGCTTDHTGTSASAPLAAGIVALGLQANPALTWRDVQHIAVWTSEPAPLMENDGWHKNGRGLYANTRFGFGLMNAESFVIAARDWKLAPKQIVCKTTFPDLKTRTFASNKPGVVRFRSDACEGKSSHVKYLEHIQLVADVSYYRRGNLAIYLTSPAGTRTQLLNPRKRDNSKAGFRRWPFMSVHTWGEDPAGSWQLEIEDKVGNDSAELGQLNSITLILYGTNEIPEHYKEPRQYNMHYNKVHDRAVRKKRVEALKKRAQMVSKSILDDWQWQQRQIRESKTGRKMSASQAERELDRVDRALELFDKLNLLKRTETPASKQTIKEATNVLFERTVSK